MRQRLPDLLPPHAALVVCGTAAGAVSAARGAYYAHPGNQFWSVLARTRLTPRQLDPGEFAALRTWGIGLTDLEQRRAGADADVLTSPVDLAAFHAKLAAVAPRLVAFNGKKAAVLALGRPVTYGRQLEHFGTAEVWVLPSTSGAARGVWDEAVWRQCATRVRALQRAPVTTPARGRPPRPARRAR